MPLGEFQDLDHQLDEHLPEYNPKGRLELPARSKLARTHHHRPRIESQPTGSGIHYVTLSPASDDDVDIGKRNDDGRRCTDCTQPNGCEEQPQLACSQIMLVESVRKCRRLALMSVTMPRGLGVSAPHSLPNEASSSAVNRHAMTLAML